MAAPQPDAFYDANIQQWEENRDCVAGQRAIHAKGRRYLPAPNGMEGSGTQQYRNNVSERDTDCPSEYEDFLRRTLFLNATSRTVEGTTGLIFRKNAIIEASEMVDVENVDGSGNSIEHFMFEALRESAIVSRVGVLVDHPEVDGEITAQEAEELGIKPQLVMYRAEEIIRTRSRIVGGRSEYTQVVLCINSYQPSADNEFEDELVTQFIVLDLAPIIDAEGEPINEGQVFYRQRVLDEEGGLVSVSFPMMNGEPMTFIPFEIIEVNSSGKSIIEDLVKANLNHYMMNASYTHGVFYTGFPTPWATGVTEDETDEINGIGPNSFWTAGDPSASFGMLEFTGQGLTSSENYLNKIIELMAALGADMLKTQRMAAESEGAKRLDKQANDSTLMGLVYQIEKSFTRIMTWYSLWSGVQDASADNITIELNKDFNSAQMDPSLLRELLSALMQGAISYDTFWYNMQKGELARADVTASDERERTDQGEF